MSVVKANSHQIGQSVTATNNFTWYQPATPDGTVRLGNGNSGSVTDLVTLTSAGNLGIGTSSPSFKLHVNGTGSVASAVQGTTDASFLTNVNGTNAMYIHSTAANTEFNELRAVPQTWVINGTERMRLDSSGNLGLGVTPSGWSNGFKAFEFGNKGNAVFSNGSNDLWTVSNAYFNGSNWIYGASNYASAVEQVNGVHKWYNAPSGTAGNAISFTQAMTLDSSGNLLVGTTSSSVNARAAITQPNDIYYCLNLENTTTGSTPLGIRVKYTASGPNNAGAVFLTAADNSATRFELRSNGGLANFSANNVNLSDERVKTAITPAPSWLPKINAIEVVNFKYKDQTFEEPNLGVIAQQVLSVAPELVDEDGFGETPEDGIPLMAIYETDLKYAMLKAIQELSAQVSDLKTELNELKQKVNA